MQRTSVVRFGSVADAAGKLNKLSGNHRLCSRRYARSPGILPSTIRRSQKHFRPRSRWNRPPATIGWPRRGNAAYVSGLIQLQAALQQLAENRKRYGRPIPGNLGGERGAGDGSSDGEPVPRSTKRAESAPRRKAFWKIPSNSPRHGSWESPGGRKLRSPRVLQANTASLISKYPFDPKASARATQGEFDAIFKPGDGALWKLYMSTLNKLLTKQGAEYVANPGGGMTVTPQFLSFFNRAAAVSDAFYKGGSQTANLNFSLRPVPSEAVVQEITLTINGKTATLQEWQGRSAAVLLARRGRAGSET